MDIDTSAIDFEIDEIPLVAKINNGLFTDIPRKALFRTDIKKFVSIVGSDYKVVPHREIFDHFKELLDRRGYKFTVDIRTNNSGSRFYGNFLMNDIAGGVGNRVGDIVKLSLQVMNSLDMSSCISLRVNTYRVICENRATTSSKVFSLSKQHTKSLVLDDVYGRIEEAILYFKEHLLPFYNRLADKSIAYEEALAYFDAVVAENIIPQKYKDNLIDSYLHPQGERVVNNTLWGLYNAITATTTRFVESYERSMSLASAFEMYLRNKMRG